MLSVPASQTGERKLYLLIEGDEERKVKGALAQVRERASERASEQGSWESTHRSLLPFLLPPSFPPSSRAWRDEQFKKLLQEATMESTENTRPLFAKYTV